MLSRAFTRREKVLLTILALLLVFAFYYLVIEVRVGDAIDSYKEQIAFDDQQIAALSAQKAKMDAMKAELEEIMKQDDPIIVPDYDNLQEVMIFLNTVLSITNDYSINFGNAQMPAEGSYIVQRDVQINFSAPSYDVAKTVISGLQDSHFCCRVSNVSIVPGVNGHAITDGNVSVGLSMSFYEAKRQ